MESYQNGDAVTGSVWGWMDFFWGITSVDIVLWWHWVAVGLILLSVDVILLNVFYLIWVGLSAICTGLTLWLFPDMHFWLQALSFGFYTVASLVLWIVVLRPRYLGKQQQQANLLLPGQSGIVIHFNHHSNQGTLRLQRPVGGKDVWEFECAHTVQAGDRVHIESINHTGNLVVLKPS